MPCLAFGRQGLIVHVAGEVQGVPCVAQVDGDGDGVDGEGAEFGAVVIAAVADFFGNFAGEVQVPVGAGAVVVACCGDGEHELAGAIKRLGFGRAVAGFGEGFEGCGGGCGDLVGMPDLVEAEEDVGIRYMLAATARASLASARAAARSAAIQALSPSPSLAIIAAVAW